MGWLARKHGLQANAVTALELVTADGALRARRRRPRARAVLGAARGRRQLRRGDRDRVRRLRASRSSTPGRMFFPFERAGEVLHTWAAMLARVAGRVHDVGVACAHSPTCPTCPSPRAAGSFAVVDGRVPRQRGRGPGAAAAAARARPGARHLRDGAARGARRPGDGPARPAAVTTATSCWTGLPAGAVDAVLARRARAPVSPPDDGAAAPRWAARWPRGAPGAGARATLPGEVCHVRARRASGRGVGRRRARRARRGRRAPSARTAAATTRTSSRSPADASALLRRRDLGAAAAVKAVYDPDDLFRGNHHIPPAD